MRDRTFIGLTLIGYSVLFTALKLFGDATNGDGLAVTILGGFVLGGMLVFPPSNRPGSDL